MQNAEAAPLDPLIGRIQSDWKSVANGGTLDALQRDLQELQKRDFAPGADRDQYGKDLLEINVGLMKQNLLPNLELLGARDNKVLMIDRARHDQLVALQPGLGMVQVVDVDLQHGGEQLVVKQPVALPDALKGPITPDGVHQGAEVPDCRLEARLASLAQADPQAIARMIKDNGNGSYTVTFPGDRQHPVTVATPTDWEKATFSNGADGGADAGNEWALIIDKAFRQRINQPFGPYGPAPNVEGLLTGKPEALLVPIAQECTTIVGAVDYLMSKYDGNAACVANVSKEPLARRVECAQNRPITGVPADTGKYLQEALNNHMIVTTFVDSDKLKATAGRSRYGTDSQGRLLELMDGHAYSVTNYDAAKQTVTLRNPWGVNYDDKKKLVGDGYVTLTLDQFKRMIGGIDVELTGRSK